MLLYVIIFIIIIFITGTKDVKVYVPLAGGSQATTITYTLQLSSLSTSEGSMAGGMPLTITGTGFTSNTSLIEVRIGNEFGCKVTSATDTTIQCDTGPSAKVVPIDNSGFDSCKYALHAQI